MLNVCKVSEAEGFFEFLGQLATGCPHAGPHVAPHVLANGQVCEIPWNGINRLQDFWPHFLEAVTYFRQTHSRKENKPFLAIFLVGVTPLSTQDMRDITKALWGEEIIFSFLARGEKKDGGVFEMDDDGDDEVQLRGIIMLRWRLLTGEAIEPSSEGGVREEIQAPYRREEFRKKGGEFLRTHGIDL